MQATTAPMAIMCASRIACKPTQPAAHDCGSTRLEVTSSLGGSGGIGRSCVLPGHLKFGSLASVAIGYRSVMSTCAGAAEAACTVAAVVVMPQAGAALRLSG